MSEETSADAAASSAGTGDGTRRGKSRDKPYDPEGLIGRTLAGRYEVKKCIGQGGMGVVYLASQQALERMVVIKVLSRSLDDDDEASGRFEREALGMSRLDHPNIVSIYDFGHEDGHSYICMEYVDGGTLSRRIKRDGGMSVEAFAHIASQLLKGIGEAHSLGLIHRDIKPSNIMLTERHGQQDYVKILDFGLAKLVHNARQVTKEQSLVGSTAFLSPEQIMGNDIDQRVDVYALGVLFYYMLTGVKPFTADDDITVLYQHVHHAPPALGEHLPDGRRVPEELADLLYRMLAKDPDDRPPDAGTIHRELVDIIATTSLEIPWEGEGLGSLSSSSSVSGPIPSGTVPTQDSAQQAAPSSGSQPSGHSFVTDEQMFAMQKANNRRTMLIVMVVILIFAGGFGAFWMLRGDHASAESVATEIARAEQLVDQGKLGRAESVLELTRSDLRHHPSLKERFAASQDRLAIAKLLADARFHEDQGELQGAIGNYREILSRNSDHQQAREALDRLLAEVEQQEATAAVEEAPADKEPDASPEVQVPEDETATAKPAKVRKERARAEKPASSRNKPTRDKPARAKPTPAKPTPAKQDNSKGLLLPIDEKPSADKEPSNDDVQLLPIE
jgi:serine/threonine protein kinase